MTAKSICFILNSASRNGAGVAEAARLQALVLSKEKSLSVQVMVMSDENLERDRSSWENISIKSFRPWGPRRLGFSPMMAFELLRLKPDIVHVHGIWQFHCFCVWLWSLITGKPYVISPHGMLETWIRARSPGLKKAVSRLYHDRFLRSAAGYHLLTEKERSDVKMFVGKQPQAVIVNYVKMNVCDGIKPAWWLSEFEGRRIFLYLGRIHEKKGCMELCDAWERHCREDDSFRKNSVMVFCGWNDGLAGFEKRVEGLRSELGNIHFVGPQFGQEKHRSLNAASLFVLPSKSEGLPMAILEAWAAGVPVIMTPECNLPEGFKANAAIMTHARPEDLLATLRATGTIDDAQLQKMGEAGANLVRQHYAEESVLPKLLLLYRSSYNYRMGRQDVDEAEHRRRH